MNWALGGEMIGVKGVNVMERKNCEEKYTSECPSSAAPAASPRG